MIGADDEGVLCAVDLDEIHRMLGFERPMGLYPGVLDWRDEQARQREDDGRNCRWTWGRMMDKTREEWKR